MLQRIVRPTGGLPRVATVIRWAKRNHVRVLEDGAGGVFTTVDALNAALGLVPGQQEGGPEDSVMEQI